jgi:hypothetical protein
MANSSTAPASPTPSKTDPGARQPAAPDATQPAAAGASEPAAAGDDTPVEPVGDAGVFDVDPDQSDVDQDSEAVITGDVDAFPEDEEE